MLLRPYQEAARTAVYNHLRTRDDNPCVVIPTGGGICTPDHFLNHVCYEIGIHELIGDGYLSPLVTKSGIHQAYTSGLHVRGGEYVAGEAESLMDHDDLFESACAEIVEQTSDRKSVLIFATGVKHGRHIARVLGDRHRSECGFNLVNQNRRAVADRVRCHSRRNAGDI